MLWRRLLLGGLGALLIIVTLGLFLLVGTRPAEQSRTEIFKGVFLTVEDWPKSYDGEGAVMIVEVHWETPGIRIANRPFDYAINADDSVSPHYNLEFADFALRRERPAVLMNTNLFFPDSITSAIPGRPVRAVETVVVDGQASHVHAHSYLLYWDKLMDAYMAPSKPPDEASLAQAEIGLGLQGVQIRDGAAIPAALDGKSDLYARTFIGINPERKILYLMAFENASGHGVIERAVRAGVTHGGQLDSGSSTNLLIGPKANGVRAHTGIRNARPLGPYLMIYAAPL